ncbi:MAG: hypothetical protein HGB10_04095 [Coriobacteriia bacterium]|nr:hypothetical protein [Coriobacteriia bacterium]
MAIVRSLEQANLGHRSTHTEVEATYTVVNDDSGDKMLQVDTYGSADRAIPGKKSQSIRFAPEAIAQLKAILDSEF